MVANTSLQYSRVRDKQDRSDAQFFDLVDTFAEQSKTIVLKRFTLFRTKTKRLRTIALLYLSGARPYASLGVVSGSLTSFRNRSNSECSRFAVSEYAGSL